MFEVIGERINTSRKLVQAAVAERDADYILEAVKKQQEAGASFIDVNAGARIDHEKEGMRWLLDTIQPICDSPLALDSPDPAIIDPLDKKIMANIKTADMLLAHDPFCMNYLKEVRSSAIERANRAECCTDTH